MDTHLNSNALRAVLDRMFAEAERNDDVVLRADQGSAQERADALESVYMPVSRRGGELLYTLARAAKPRTVVEFGTSYGISTLYLAAAAADNGHGHVYGTEMSATKVKAAEAALAEAGLAGHATVLSGDARTALRELEPPIGMVLLDGWKDLCLPVLKILEPKLAPGALVVADDTTFSSMSDYLAYVRNPENGYVTVDFPVDDGMEISCWNGRE